MLTYCTNVHPGESWEQTLASLIAYIPKVKALVSPGKAFPIGLRLSAHAAEEIDRYAAASFLDWLEREDCFVPTINGFPFGSFSAGRVKEQAYMPDWRDRRRVEYTVRLMRLLHLWLPEGMAGSISTVPVGYRDYVSNHSLDAVRENILLTLREAERLAREGKTILLALEPEPGCYLERAEDVVKFVESLDIPSRYRPYLGVCFDCSHGAVLFEDPQVAFALLADAGIPVAKIHVSSAARLTHRHPPARELFREECYLHQTFIKRGEMIASYRDLTDAPPREPEEGEEWRVHYHLPIFDDGTTRYGTTNGYIRDVLSCRPTGALLEIETYTYDVLPAELRPDEVVDGICREFEWLRTCL